MAMLLKKFRFGSGLLALLLVALTVSANSGAAAAPKVYKNCAALNQVYKYGVSAKAKPKNRGTQAIYTPAVNAPVFDKNKKLDFDGDFIACEVVRKVAEPAPSTAVPIDTALAFAKPLETCQLKETANFAGAGAKGFPARQTVPATGEVGIAIIPVDFANAIGKGSPEELYRDDVSKIEQWGKFFSRGKLTYKVQLKADSWLRAPKGADWYTCVECQKGAKEQKQSRQDALQQLVSLADAAYDFSETDIAYFVFPYEAEKLFGSTIYAHRATVATNEGQITVSAYGEMGGGVGAISDRSKIWDHAIHEFLHFQGFVGHGPENGSDYYITTHQWGASKAITSWEAFLNGWFGSDEILCLDRSDLSNPLLLTLDPIDNFGARPESLMIRIDDSQLLILELRANGPFSDFSSCTQCNLPSGPGFTAYRVNVNGVHYRDDNDPNGADKNFWSYVRQDKRAVFDTSIEFAGIKITKTGANRVSLSLSK